MSKPSSREKSDLILDKQVSSKEESDYLETRHDATCSIKASTGYSSMLSQLRPWGFTQPTLWIRPNHIEISVKKNQVRKKRVSLLDRTWKKECITKTNLRIMTAMFEFFEKSKMISSAIFLAFPYGLIGT